MRNLRLFWQAIRGPFLIASAVPVLLGTAIAYAQLAAIELLLFVLALLGCMLLHAGANVANNYYDWLFGADGAKPPQALSGGTQLVHGGQLQPRTLRNLYRLLYFAASVCGLVISRHVGYVALFIGFLGLVLGHGYTAPPISFSYRGWGELVTGVTFGPLSVLGSYYAQTASLDWQPLLASLPLGLLITAVLYINEFPDRNTDEAAGKMTWVVLSQGRAIGLYQLLIVLALLFSLPLFFLADRWIIVLFLGLVALGLHIAWQGGQISFRPDQIIQVQAKTIVFYTLTGLLLCFAYLKA